MCSTFPLPTYSSVSQRFVRSVLCTRLAIPSAENVSNSVLRAVLCGDANALVEASRRGRLKGVAVALTADDRRDLGFLPTHLIGILQTRSLDVDRRRRVFKPI